MPATTTEKTIESYVVKKAYAMGVKLVIKLELRHDTAWPDRLFLLPGGRAVFIEFKRKGKRPTSKQTYRLRQLVKQGYDAAWFDNADDAVCYLAGKMAAPRGPEEGG